MGSPIKLGRTTNDYFNKLVYLITQAENKSVCMNISTVQNLLKLCPHPIAIDILSKPYSEPLLFPHHSLPYSGHVLISLVFSTMAGWIGREILQKDIVDTHCS